MTESTRRTIRTVLQGLIAFAVIAPLVVQQLGLDTDKLPWLAGTLAVLAAITKVMNLPQVEQFLQQYLPGIASGVALDGRHEAGRNQDSADGAGGDDAGRATQSLVLVLAAVFVVVLTTPAWAHRPPTVPAAPPVSGPAKTLILRDALICDGVLWALFDTETRDGLPVQDDGGVLIRVHYTGGRPGTVGEWRPAPIHRRSEGRLGYDQRLVTLPLWDAVDVARAGDTRVHSNSLTPRAGCPA